MGRTSSQTILPFIYHIRGGKTTEKLPTRWYASDPKGFSWRRSFRAVNDRPYDRTDEPHLGPLVLRGLAKIFDF
jgi:hypothetical protein